MSEQRNTRGRGTPKPVLELACANAGWNAGLAERRRQAFELRQMRKPYRVIAEELGISVGRAYEDVQAVLGALLPVEDAESLRRAEADNLDRLEAVLLTKMADAPTLAIIDRVLAIQARRAKLLGLDAPTKVEGTMDVRLSAPEEIASLRDELAQRRERRAG